MPWVGGGISDWFSLDFRNPILLTKLEMNGGDVNVYGNGTLVKCFVTRFWLYYKNRTAGQWYKYYPVGNQNATVQWDVPDTVFPVVYLPFIVVYWIPEENHYRIPDSNRIPDINQILVDPNYFFVGSMVKFGYKCQLV